MEISASLVKKLRDQTGAGFQNCKIALEESNGEIEKAVEWLRKKGLADAAKKSGRATNAGRIFTYIHAGGQIGIMIEMDCETDFVANTTEFQELGKDICMQICAMNPVAITREDIPEAVINREKEIYKEQVKDKPAAAQEKIIQGKLDKFYKDFVLMEQIYIKDDTRTVEAIVKEKIANIKENITIKRFARFQVGG